MNKSDRKKTYICNKTQKQDDISINISEDNKIEISDGNEYIFKPGMIPPKKQVYYQVNILYADCETKF